MVMFSNIQKRILIALAAAPEGRLTVAELTAMYAAPGDGIRHSILVREGLTQWIRQSDAGSKAVAVEITDSGRKFAEQFAKEMSNG